MLFVRLIFWIIGFIAKAVSYLIVTLAEILARVMIDYFERRKQ